MQSPAVQLEASYLNSQNGSFLISSYRFVAKINYIMPFQHLSCLTNYIIPNEGFTPPLLNGRTLRLTESLVPDQNEPTTALCSKPL